MPELACYFDTPSARPIRPGCYCKTQAYGLIPYIIEDENFSGYGFTVAHNFNLVWIEHRDWVKATALGPKAEYKIQKEKWHKFNFFMKTSGIFDLELYDKSGKKFLRIANISDVNH